MYEVGQLVRIIDNDKDSTDSRIGKIRFIKKIHTSNADYPYVLEGEGFDNVWWGSHELELVVVATPGEERAVFDSSNSTITKPRTSRFSY